jgi:hypothetical protein
MTNIVGGVMGLLIVLAAPSLAAAQTVFVGVGYPLLWDDETFLGAGVAVSGGVSYPLSRHLEVEGELASARHVRDSGYLAAEGAAVAGAARIAYLFQQPAARVRLFGSAGVGVIRSAGTLTTPSFVPRVGGTLVEGALTERDWTLTKPAYEFGAGFLVAAGRRLGLRPELRWTATSGSSSSSVVEPPIWMIRAGVAVTWRLSDE